MKSIALIFTKSKEKVGQGMSIPIPVLPHALLHLSSYLKDKKVKVYLIDGQICNIQEELDKIIDKVDIIGFSVMTMQVSPSLELSKYIKKNYPNKEIIWGGIHPSLLPTQTVLNQSIDYVCQREGEKCLYELACDKPLAEIENLVYKEDGSVIMNPFADFIDMNKSELPHWELFEIDKYISKSNLAGRDTGNSFPITSGRGCIFNCAFCINTALGHSWRPLSAKNIIKRIKFLKKKYNIQHFNINDDCFDIDLKRVDDFCEMLINENLNVTWDVSVHAGKQWDDNRMKLMHDAGCTSLSVGAESGSPRILNMIHKPTTVEGITFLAKQCNKYDITLVSSWMSAFPDETKEELQQTINLLKKVIRLCPSSSIHGPQPLKLYPNSELYFEAVKRGFKIPGSLEEWAEKSERGYIQDGKLPWVKNPKRLRAIEFYCMNSVRTPRNFLQKVLVEFSRARLKYNFWYLPFEIPLTEFYLKKILKV